MKSSTTAMLETKNENENENQMKSYPSHHLFTVSAKTEKALEDFVTRYQDYLSQSPSLGDVCFSGNTGRSHYGYRLGIVAQTLGELQEKLQQWKEGNFPLGVYQRNPQEKTTLKTVFLFTGQGSQYANMGKGLFDRFPVFRESILQCANIFDRLSDKPLLTILYPQSESETINSTQYTQPAIFTLEYALAQLWMSWGILPNAIIGHSVGEYVAACIAGVFSLEEGLTLLTQRARLMQQLPQKGGMVAIFSDFQTVKGLIVGYEQQLSIAAINGSDHIVISGNSQVIEQLLPQLDKQEIKYKPLTVSHAFHSPLMEGMLKEFSIVAQKINYCQPQIPLISNLTGKPVTDEITQGDYWVNHIIQPVQFLDSIQYLFQENYNIFLEIGAKPILTGMANREWNQFPTNNHPKYWLSSLRENYEDNQIIFSSLAQLYALGAKINWDAVYPHQNYQRLLLPHYPFQRQRYWVENHYTLSRHTSLNTALKDYFYQINWQLSPLSTPCNLKENLLNWLIVTDKQGLGNSIARILLDHDHSCQVLPPQEITLEVLKETQFDRIIHLSSLNYPEIKEFEDIHQSQDDGWKSVLSLTQQLTQLPYYPQLWLITQNLHSDNHLSPHSTLWGMGKVIALESPEIWGGMIDIVSDSLIEISDLVLQEIISNSQESQIIYRNQTRYIPRLCYCQSLTDTPSLSKHSSLKINPDATYLITGGLGALGLTFAEYLIQKGAKHLILLARKSPNDKISHTLQQWKAKGVNLYLRQGDVSHPEILNSLFKEIKETLPPLKGILHTAGVLDDGVLQQQTPERFQKVLSPKVEGSWLLHHLTKDIALDFFVLFSSIASLLGSPGQSNYASSNYFLDSIAHFRQKNNLPAISINWGAISAGMATQKRLSTQGIIPLDTETVLKSFDLILALNLPQIGVLNVNWVQLQQQFLSNRQVSFLENVLPQAQINTNSVHSSSLNSDALFESLLSLQLPEKEAYLTNYLQTSLAKILQIPSNQLSLEDSLLDSGMDSLMVMEAISQLKSDLKLMLYPREFYERPKINLLANYLANEFETIHQKTNIKSLKVIPSSDQQPLSIGDSENSASSIVLNIPKKLSPIAFILSSPRAGSTLLRVMLAGHPQLSSPPELHLLPFLNLQEREQELGASYLGEGLQRSIMELKGITAVESHEIVQNWTEQNLTIFEVYEQLQLMAGNKLIVDKSPTYGMKKSTLDRAEQYFDRAKYIHLLRHPYSVIESFTRLRMDKLVGKGEDNPFFLAESIWTKSNQNILNFCQSIDSDRHHLLYYEELVENPQPVMEKLCEFLGVEFDPAVLNPYEGKRMTDGVYNQSLSLGDPNFLKHQKIESELATAWQRIKLPYPLSDLTRNLTETLNYQLIPENESILDYPMTETFLNVRGFTLCLCTWGDPQSPPILLIHGLLEQGASWMEVAQRLAVQGYYVIAPDLRGHGKSDHVSAGSSYNVLDLVGDIEGIVTQFINKSFILVGHSMGTIPSALYASIRPKNVKKLVLVEPILPSVVSEKDTLFQLSSHLNYLTTPPENPVFSGIEVVVERLRTASSRLSPELALQLARRLTIPCEGGVTLRYAPMLRLRAGLDFNGFDRTRYLTVLKSLEIPVILLYGSESNFNREEDLMAQQNALISATKITVSGGHNLHFDAPLDIVKAVVMSV